MINRHTYDQITWFDLVSPTSEEIRQVANESGLPIAFTTDLTAPGPHCYAEWTKGVFKLVLDFPIVKRTDMQGPHRLKCIATKHALITVRFEDIQAIERFATNFEIVGLLKRASGTHTGADILLTLLYRLYTDLDDKLDYLVSRMADIDEEIIRGREREMVTEIALVGRRLLSFRQAVDAHENPLGLLYSHIPEAFGKHYQPLVIKLNERYLHISRRVQRSSASLQELRENNNSLISTKQNEIMKTLTIMAFVTFPLTLVSSIFGMNTISTPIVGAPGDFWIILSFMTTAFICFFLYFRYKNWL